LHVVDRVPSALGHAPGGGFPATEESAWKNCWNWNLCDAAYGSLLLDIKEGRVSAELKSQGVWLDPRCPSLVHSSPLLGFNYAYRRSATPTTQPTPTSTKPSLPPQTATSVTPIKAQTPAPAEKATPQGPDVLSPSRAMPSTSEPASGKETPPIVKVNGSDATAPGSAEKDKGERDREKHKPKRNRRDHDRDRAGKDAAVDAEGSSGERKDDAAATTTTTAPPKPEVDTTGSPAPGSDAGPQSPRTESTHANHPQAGSASLDAVRAPTKPYKRDGSA
jgi:hypothetical protein